MGIVDKAIKTLGVAGVAVGGIVAATKLLKDNEKQKKDKEELEKEMKNREAKMHQQGEMVNKKCISCSAPLVGKRGQLVHCKYCDTDQTV